VAFYANAQQFYTCMQALFDSLQQEAPELAQSVLASRQIIRLRCNTPTAEITINARQNTLEPRYGANSLQADLEASLATDTMHRMLLGELSPEKAFATGKVKVKGKGPMGLLQVTTMDSSTIIAIVRAGQRFYPDILKAQGLLPQ
jgi:putative sterol carrier protein